MFRFWLHRSQCLLVSKSWFPSGRDGTDPAHARVSLSGGQGREGVAEWMPR